MTPEGFLFVATKRNPSDSKEKNAFWVGQFGDTGNSGHHTVWDFQVAIPKIYARLGCHCLTARTTTPTNYLRKRSGAKRRRAKKTAPQSRKVHGIPTYLRRTAKIKLIPGILTHPKRLSFRGLGGFLWPRPKKASQERCGGLPPRNRAWGLQPPPITPRVVISTWPKPSPPRWRRQVPR